jgi:L-seryl-tRNA(Ser) seleniumtransferase
VSRDHAGIRARETGYLTLWMERLRGIPGVTACLEPDPTRNPLDRLKLAVDPERARITAWDLADALAAGDPPVIVGDHVVEHGYFYLDPCNLHPGEAEIVAERIAQELERARTRPPGQASSAADRKARRFQRLLSWPD